MKPDSYRDMIFIAAPREMSQARFKQIMKHYLPKASILVGISREPNVVGFEEQPQFKMLKRSTIQPIVDRVNALKGAHQIEVLEYSQAELPEIVSSHEFKRVLLVNGSWKFTFQNHSAYAVLNERRIPFKYISPFVDEDEAKAYEASHTPSITQPDASKVMSEDEMLAIAAESAKQSYDYSFQTGAVLGKKVGEGYKYVLEAFNKVVPYQTYALHHGNSREKYVTGVHDTNHYDTIHAEMLLLIRALQQTIDIAGATLFINLLPCPTCARTLSQTDINEVVYVNDHSDGYATKLLQDSGKTVRKAVYTGK